MERGHDGRYGVDGGEKWKSVYSHISLNACMKFLRIKKIIIRIHDENMHVFLSFNILVLCNANIL